MYKISNRSSKGKISRSPSTAPLFNNYLFTSTMCFSDDALSARPYRWPRKRFRDIIHVGLNTLSKAYQNMKQQITTVAKIVPVVLIMWVITSILLVHG